MFPCLDIDAFMLSLTGPENKLLLIKENTVHKKMKFSIKEFFMVTFTEEILNRKLYLLV